MPKNAADICLAGVVMYCRATKNWLKVSVVERSNDASNYRGELIGAILSLLILRAATVNLVAPFSHAKLFCDNRGVIFHSNSPLFSLSEKQKQADMIQLIKHLSCTNKCQSTWEWVEGHAVECKGWRNCTLPKSLNYQADELAKAALLVAIAGEPTMEEDFPFKPVQVKISKERVCGSPRQALESDWGYCTAKKLFKDKGIIWAGDLHLVWWESLGAAMSQYPKNVQGLAYQARFQVLWK
jgi:ribonuclease HI